MTAIDRVVDDAKVSLSLERIVMQNELAGMFVERLTYASLAIFCVAGVAFAIMFVRAVIAGRSLRPFFAVLCCIPPFGVLFVPLLFLIDDK